MERRRFSLLDAMALIAATALGLGLVRAHFLDLNANRPEIFASWPPITAMHYRVTGFGPLLAAWSLAMIGLHLIPPRPSFRHLARSPGFAASLASGFAIALCIGTNSAVRLAHWAQGIPVMPLDFVLDDLPGAVPIAIASAWISIAAGRRWRRRRGRDWRELLGLTVAWAWILLYATLALILACRD